MKKYLLLLIFSFSCTKDGDLCLTKLGYLKLKNGSLNTIQKIKIDGVGYGSLDPGDSETYDLGPGRHSVEIIGVSGGKGCSPFEVTIVQCETESKVCNN